MDFSIDFDYKFLLRFYYNFFIFLKIKVWPYLFILVNLKFAQNLIQNLVLAQNYVYV